MARRFDKKLGAAKAALEPKKEPKKPVKTAPAKANETKKKAPKTTESILDEVLGYKNTIKILEARNRQLQDILDHSVDKDRPYAHSKGTKYQTFGRTKTEYDDLMKISRHLLNTNKRATNAIEKIENYPLKIRDKLILALEVITSVIDEGQKVG